MILLFISHISGCFWLLVNPTDAARVIFPWHWPCWSLPPRLDLNTSKFVHETLPRSLFCHLLVILVSILNPEQQLFPKPCCEPSNPKAPSAPNTDSQGDKIHSDNGRQTERGKKKKKKTGQKRLVSKELSGYSLSKTHWTVFKASRVFVCVCLFVLLQYHFSVSVTPAAFLPTMVPLSIKGLGPWVESEIFGFCSEGKKHITLKMLVFLIELRVALLTLYQ